MRYSVLAVTLPATLSGSTPQTMGAISFLRVPKYQLREVEVLQNSRIVFESEGRRFEWIMSAPLTAKAAIARLWMMHDQYQPLNERKNPGGVIGAATHYEYILPVSKQ
jgi:hypothetical protein